MKQSPSEPLDSDKVLQCSYCGYLGLSVVEYGFALHKEQCPIRTNIYHQGNRPPKIESPSEEQIKEQAEQVWGVLKMNIINTSFKDQVMPFLESAIIRGKLLAESPSEEITLTDFMKEKGTATKSGMVQVELPSEEGKEIDLQNNHLLGEIDYWSKTSIRNQAKIQELESKLKELENGDQEELWNEVQNIYEWDEEANYKEILEELKSKFLILRR